MRKIFDRPAASPRTLLISAAAGLLALTAACSSSNHHTTGGASAAADQSSLSTHSSTNTSTAPVTKTSAPATPATQRLVVRPVTARGTVAAGYTLARHIDESIDCGSKADQNPSHVAVSANISECFPTAAYPVACWSSATPKTALCYRNPFAKQVDLVSTDKALPTETAPKQAAPYALVLSDGSRCTYRIGGAWALLDGHPDLYGTYGCDSEVVWGPADSDGINIAHARWTVQVAPSSGHGSLRTVTVVSATFVGTAS